jgi:hypothetical protein
VGHLIAAERTVDGRNDLRSRIAGSERAEQPIRPGVYRHFKGQLYEVLGTAPLVDTESYFVVYRPLYGDRALVLRLQSEFAGTVNRDGHEEPRFQFVEPASGQTLVSSGD